MTAQSNLEKYEKDLKTLYLNGVRLYTGLLNEHRTILSAIESATLQEYVKKIQPLDFIRHYESWYSESLAVIRQVIPNRLDDFIALYKRERRSKITFESYTLSDYMIGLVVKDGFGRETFDAFRTALAKFQQQLHILDSAQQRFRSSLFDIKQLVRADLFDSELDAAKELQRNGFLRAAGAVAGVVLEKHLEQVCGNHQINVTKKDPTIGDLNDLLKNNNVIGIPQWRFNQHLADFRNLCDHNKKQDPSEAQVSELITGVEKVTKTLF